MEPLRLAEGSPHRAPLTDLALELARKSAGLRRALPGALGDSLAEALRAMNCYYSNLIEGHDTHPLDIERALRADYSRDARKRDLQLEARAHVEVQRWIDGGGLVGSPVRADNLRAVHRRFCEALPDALLRVADPAGGGWLRVRPGEWRDREVQVGQHVAAAAAALPRFMARFEAAYADLGPTEALLAAAAAHHRLVWIHPFHDGNGRVARLMSHAMLQGALDSGALWSVSRALARDAAGYKAQLAACDRPRRNDLDGRGALSEEGLAAFTRYFLTACLDQVSFMEGLIDPGGLRARIRLWAREEIELGALPPRADAVLEAVALRGELPRGEAAAAAGTGERNARRIVAALVGHGVLGSATPYGPLRLVFKAALAPRWLPGLFP
jgi:Fic family protein